MGDLAEYASGLVQELAGLSVQSKNEIIYCLPADARWWLSRMAGVLKMADPLPTGGNADRTPRKRPRNHAMIGSRSEKVKRWDAYQKYVKELHQMDSSLGWSAEIVPAAAEHFKVNEKTIKRHTKKPW